MGSWTTTCGAGVAHGDGHVEAGGVADVVAVGLEGGAQHGDAAAAEVAVEGLAGEVDGGGAAAQVDLVDLAQERDGVLGAELAGAGHEGADVLGQAAAAEAEAGGEEPVADAGVVADGLGEVGDVGAGGLADLGHGVDEGDLGREEGVRGDLDQLGGGEVGDQEGDALGDDGGVDLAHEVLGALGAHADDEAVGVQGVGDGVALAQELRVPGDLDALGVGQGEVVGDLDGGADGDGGLADDQGAGAQVGGQGGDRAEDLGHVGLLRAGGLRGSHADEVDVGERPDLGPGGGEPSRPASMLRGRTSSRPGS